MKILRILFIVLLFTVLFSNCDTHKIFKDSTPVSLIDSVPPTLDDKIWSRNSTTKGEIITTYKTVVIQSAYHDEMFYILHFNFEVSIEDFDNTIPGVIKFIPNSKYSVYAGIGLAFDAKVVLMEIIDKALENKKLKP